MTELEWLDDFGNNLADRLYYANMSQRELADAAGLSEAAVSSYIRKQKIPSLKAIINIAYVLGITVDELLGTEYFDKIV